MVGAALTDGTLPTPTSPDADWVTYLQQNGGPVRTVALLQLLSAVGLAVFTAGAVTLARRRGAGWAMLTVAAVGGVVSTAMLAASGLTQWVMARPEVSGQGPLVHAFGDLSFVLGGAGHVVFLGLLLGGLSLPAIALRLTPRWVSILGLVLGAVALLSSLSVVVYGLSALLPIARFLSFIWVIAVSVTLPRGLAARRP